MSKPLSGRLLISVTVCIALIAAIYFMLQKSTSVPYSSTLLDFKKHGELSVFSKESSLLVSIDIEIAENDKARRAGMMYRHEFLEHQGMLFIFDRQEIMAFWMRTTFQSLDMIFIDEALEIVTIEKNATPDSEKRYYSSEPAIYVLEVQSGFTDKYGIEVGDRIEWARDQASPSDTVITAGDDSP